jgi:hypothetical protein
MTKPRQTPQPAGASARQVIQATLPEVLKMLSMPQLQQAQRVMDAAVVNPAVQKEAGEYFRKATKTYGSISVKDPELVRRGEQAMRRFIVVTEADKRIKLDVDKLLDSDALRPRTDNPDEAAYLEKVYATLKSRGVYLRMQKKLVPIPDEPSRLMVDPAQFEVWLSLGPDGYTIPTTNGRLTREALLGTTTFGAGYYEAVHRGPIQTEMDKQIRRLLSEIDSGIYLHNLQAKNRRQAFPGVTEVSDLLGGADFPSRSIWDRPHKLVLRAMQLNTGGNVKGAQVFLVVAAYETRDAMNKLDQAIQDSISGAERAVKVLKVLKTAGEVAEVVLLSAGFLKAIRGGVAVAEGASVDALAEKFVGDYLAKNPAVRQEIGSVRWVKGPKGSVGGGVKPGTSAGHGTGWDKW